MRLKNKKIGILIESDYFEEEIFYYQFRFPEEGAELHFLTRLWGQDELQFHGHEYKAPIQCNESFEEMSDEELNSYDAIIIPSGIVADRLRYSEDVTQIPPASQFMKRAFENENIIKGIICHGMWLMSPISDVIRGRRVTVHNNLISDARQYGLEYCNEDIVVDGDLVTGRTGGHCNLFAAKIIEILESK
ncbi:DJ-1/PfpI family protein [Bacillus solimangrovi]|uniref:Thiamine biosynthesis protein ThiJ n=1 Tax=Bacillus solimangrovi TaxID=1305675 RepID=A0A1E5LIC3_9BACI|nr:DJ-1/PfpI family protein [Bacillus solimangrovi]OEH93833.1 thiamine biosynthesis protein ThiJ [Bacillus solimangrovi]